MFYDAEHEPTDTPFTIYLHYAEGVNSIFSFSFVYKQRKKKDYFVINICHRVNFENKKIII